MSDIRIFGLGSTAEFAHALAAELGTTLSPQEERVFEDGEHKLRPLADLCGADVYLVHALQGEPGQSPHDKLCRLLFMLATVRDHGAARATAVVPYLCYARKDRRTRPGDPLPARYMAQLLQAVGCDALVTLDVHNPAALENAYRCRTLNLSPDSLFLDRLLDAWPEDEPCVVLAPDSGALRRAENLRKLLAARRGEPPSLGLMEKWRGGGEVSGETLFADVRDSTVILIDDMVVSGTTLVRAARAARDAGARRVLAAASHGVLLGDAATQLAPPLVDHLLLTDSVLGSASRAALPGHIEVVSCAPLFAQAIRALRHCSPGWPSY